MGGSIINGGGNCNPPPLLSCTTQPRLFKVTGSSNEYNVNIILIFVEDEFSVGKQPEHMSDQEAPLE